MVTYAQQTDPEKAKISSIGEQITPDNVAPDWIWEPKKATKTEMNLWPQSIKLDTPETIDPKTWKMYNADWSEYTGKLSQTTEWKDYWTIKDKAQSVSSRTWSYYNDVYLPKKQLEQQAKTWDIKNIEQPAPSKTQMMDTKTIAQQYDAWAISAIDLENLRTTDPLKYQEAKAEIERKRTVDAINQNQTNFLNTYKWLSESYLKQWEDLTASDDGKTLREEVFAKYWLNESNDRIKDYTTQIDWVEEELRGLEDYISQWDAFADRNFLINKNKELTRKRMDLVKARSAEMDYYRLWLEQADAVAKDYKEYQAQEIAQLWKKFEMLTGMSQMEFEMRDQQTRDYLAEIDKDIVDIKADQLEEEKRLEKEAKQAQDTILNASLLSLYDNFTQEEKAVLLWLPTESVSTLLKTVDAQAKADAERQMDIEKMNWEKYKFNTEQKSKQNNYKPVTIEIDWKKQTVLVNENWDIKPMNTDYFEWETPKIKDDWTYWWQCGAYVNRAIPWMSPNWKRFWDKLADKIDLIDSAVPIVWGAVIMDYKQIDPKTWMNYWHVWVVTWINADWTINISDSNVKWDEIVSNRTLSPNEMKKVVWYMTPPVPKQSIVDGMSTFKFWLTKEESAVFTETMNNLIEDWDIESIKTNLKDAYMSKLTAWEQEKIRSRYVIADMTQTLLQNIEQYVDQWWDVWLFAGTKEQMLNKIWKTWSKELASISTQIIDLIDKISRDRSWAALTDSEINLYTQLLPWVWKSMTYNRWVVEWLVQSVKNQDKYLDQEISKRVTWKAKDFVYPPERDQKDFAQWLQNWTATLVD